MLKDVSLKHYNNFVITSVCFVITICYATDSYYNDFLGDAKIFRCNDDFLLVIKDFNENSINRELLFGEKGTEINFDLVEDLSL